jgi:hypothetical protein
MVELSKFKTIWRPGHDFPIIPGSANLIPGSPEKIPGYDATGIPLKLLMKRTVLRVKHGFQGEIVENPVIFPVHGNSTAAPGRPEQAARLPQAIR